MNYFYILAIPLIIYSVNSFIKHMNLLPSLSGERHQLFVEQNNIPLSGGIIIIITFLFIEKFNINLFFIFIFLIGFFSDLKIIKSPRIRFFLQILCIFLSSSIKPTKLTADSADSGNFVSVLLHGCPRVCVGGVF